MLRWILSQFYVSSDGSLKPYAAAYGTAWICPCVPASASVWALVAVAVTTQGIMAAAADTTVLVCPDITDPTPVSASIVNAYAPAAGASPTFLQVCTIGESLSIAQIIHRLVAVEPAFSHGVN